MVQKFCGNVENHTNVNFRDENFVIAPGEKFFMRTFMIKCLFTKLTKTLYQKNLELYCINLVSGWKKCGTLYLAQNEDRMKALRRRLYTGRFDCHLPNRFLFSPLAFFGSYSVVWLMYVVQCCIFNFRQLNIDGELVSPQECQKLWPLIRSDDLIVS